MAKEKKPVHKVQMADSKRQIMYAGRLPEQ